MGIFHFSTSRQQTEDMHVINAGYIMLQEKYIFPIFFVTFTSILSHVRSEILFRVEVINVTLIVTYKITWRQNPEDICIFTEL